MKWQYCNESSPLALSILNNLACLCCLLFAVVCWCLFIYRGARDTNTHARVDTRTKCIVGITMTLFIISNVGGAIHTAVVMYCPDWYYLDETRQVRSGQMILLNLSQNLVNVGYNAGIVMIYYLFIKRIIISLQQSPYQISKTTTYLLYFANSLQIVLFILVIIFFSMTDSNEGNDPSLRAALFCVTILLVWYVICCIVLLTLFLKKLNSIATVFTHLNNQIKHSRVHVHSRTTKTATNTVSNNATTNSSTSANNTGNDIRNNSQHSTDLVASERYLTMMTRTTVLVGIALLSTLITSIVLSLAAIIGTEYYLVIYGFMSIMVDGLINIICLALQLEYNHKYYEKYCLKCDNLMRYQCIKQLARNVKDFEMKSSQLQSQSDTSTTQTATLTVTANVENNNETRVNRVNSVSEAEIEVPIR